MNGPAPATVLSGWSVLSGYGIGTAPFAEGITAGRSTLDPAADATAAGPDDPFERSVPVPGFDPVEYLGRKGTRKMDRMTGIAVAAVGRLLEDVRPAGDPARFGLVLGTGSGSLQSIMGFTRESYLGAKPYHVDAARFPNTVMNRAAGQSAIWHGITGPNVTVAGGRLTGLVALAHAARMQRAGHCDSVFAGAVEECSPERSWLEWHSRSDDAPGGPIGEGGAVFALESADAARAAGRTPMATVRGIRFGAFTEPEDAGTALATCVRRALDAAGLQPADVTLVVPHDDPGVFGDREREGLRASIGTSGPRWLRCRPLLGDLSAAAVALHVGAALVDGSADGRERLALVSGVDPGGTVGCALIAAASP